MKKIFIWIVLSLSLPVITCAQSNYKPGYIVNLQNDTVKGYIDYKEWGFNPKVISFKGSLNDKEPEKISVGNTNAFAVANLEYYQKAIVHVSKASVNLQSLPLHIDTSYSVDTVFLKVIITGKNVSLYALTDRIKTRFYIQDNTNKEINELNYYLYEYKYDSTITQTVYPFRSQLDTLAARYKANNQLIRQIDKAMYTQADLQGIVRSINGRENLQIEHKGLFGARFFAGTGVRYNQLNFTPEQTGIETNGAFPYGAKASSTSPLLSGGIDLLFNKNTQKIFFRMEVAFSQGHYYIPSTEVNVFYAFATLDFKQFNTSFIPQVIYNVYSKSNLKVFIDVGININVSSYNDYYYAVDYNGASSTKTKGYPEFGKEWTSIPLKFGLVIYKRVELYGSYSPAVSLNQSGGVRTANVTSYQAGINYLFGK